MPTQKRFTTRRMSDAHEDFLAKLFNGRKSKGSGNQFNDQMDGRTADSREVPLAWDGKSTYGKSVSITAAMWEKAQEQAGYHHHPILALRFYEDQTLNSVTHDLVVMDAHLFAELVEKIQGESGT